MAPEVLPLSHRPGITKTVASYLWSEWKDEFQSRKRFETEDDLYVFLEKSCEDAELPNVSILVDGDVLIGACVVDTGEFNVFPSLCPWLTYIYIHPSYKEDGYYKTLLESVLPQYEKLYVLSPVGTVRVYKNRRFETVDTTPTCAVMKKSKDEQ